MFLFSVHGDPVPQKQTQFVRKTGACYNPSRPDIERFQWQIRPYAPLEPLAGPISLDITFYFKIPASVSGIKRRQMLNQVIHHTKRPDADNCAYLVTNAMKGIMYVDDSQIIDLNIHKRYALAGRTVVKIVPIEEISPTRGEECI